MENIDWGLIIESLGGFGIIIAILLYMLKEAREYKKESNDWKQKHSTRLEKLEYRMDNNEKQLDKEEDEIKDLIKDLHSKFKDS